MTSAVSVSNTVFIARSVSVEQMDRVLDVCSERWPDKDLVVITNSNRHAEMVADPRVANAIAPTELVHDFEGVWRTDRQAETIVVPVGNSSGVGYVNVFRFLSRIRARDWYVVEQTEVLKQLDKNQILRQIRWERVVRVACSPISCVISYLLTRQEPRSTGAF